jgi:hypothetical protein
MNNFLPHKTFSNFTKNASGASTEETYKGYTKTGTKYTDLKNKIIKVATVVDSCASDYYNKMINFFRDDDNWKAIIDAYDKLGMPTSQYINPTVFRHTTCSWQNVYTFYSYARVAADFPHLDSDKKNCYQIKSALVSLEAVKANSILNDSYYGTAIDTKITEYNALFASMSCDKYIIDEEKRQAEELSKREQELAQKLQMEAYDKASGNTPTAGSKTSNYILYGFVGVAAIVFLIVLAKKVKND